MSDAVKQLNIRLPEKTHRELKARAALDGLSLVAAVEELIDAYLAGKLKLKRR
jgi:predicted HicB family RNase H-like nuclease